ncbi:MAG: benzoyl-CoA reductase subunit D [Rhodospirillaceae bacterium]|jgi:bcr-type benzoyl-CoA reductase subunit D|nr:benzoyl-CoA reductase subunit D [Rhodospirillaceae bacterium]MBT4490840.1 benzoyl-CoA reductase subunit D [Rhodospirillaceae bacterium]MBT5192061.1 benzoyl-CoA reductase subunit D [Rhodospirillaceae bacterium]MBT5899262.1 benzoyl-CoA reductase subunit D [Rhodospirillaceae bacterium]MBT6429679.1 benzoyl-CoA reductase subunit D [Rhodospirillaceae bacterium]
MQIHTTAGIDIGTGAVKAVLFQSEGGENPKWLGKRLERIRRRDPLDLARQCFEEMLLEAGVREVDVNYIATTGEGENVEFRTGHFYSMTTHARGAIFLQPDTRAAMDVGALHGRAIRVDARGKVLTYKMTSQCASGSGQFLENIARYLGVALDEVGALSQQADDPEAVSSICAVLAETDVINMVSRGISTQNILKGIHTSMADRLVKLLKSTKVDEGVVLVTGGLANDSGLVATMAERMAAQKMDGLELQSHPDSIHAGAIGAALWGAFRHKKLADLEALPIAS